MNNIVRFEDNRQFFRDQIPENAVELKTVNDRPVFPFAVGIALMALFMFLLPERRLLIAGISAFLLFCLLIKKNYPVVSFYEGFLVVYSNNPEKGSPDKLIIRDEELISWDVLGEAGKLQLYYRDNDQVRSIVITTDNLTVLSSAFGHYYNNNYGSRIRVQQFAERVKRFGIKEKIAAGFRRMLGRRK
ncbi:MAG: hypothetical protein IJM15_08170 [Erysipelotrichaceae bacterium]|nr:hypothetical protein [Erysipelotrichaceae bacterium]